LVFRKGFTFGYVVGSVLVFLGLWIHESHHRKMKQQRAKERKDGVNRRREEVV
jgi:hypothetical protein